jgi:hypothetical protein
MIQAGTLSVTGYISSNGENSVSGPSAWGGGGSGGSVLLYGGTVTLTDNRVTATGGTSGYGNYGGYGRIAAGGSSYSGTTNPGRYTLTSGF